MTTRWIIATALAACCVGGCGQSTPAGPSDTSHLSTGPVSANTATPPISNGWNEEGGDAEGELDHTLLTRSTKVAPLTAAEMKGCSMVLTAWNLPPHADFGGDAMPDFGYRALRLKAVEGPLPEGGQRFGLRVTFPLAADPSRCAWRLNASNNFKFTRNAQGQPGSFPAVISGIGNNDKVEITVYPVPRKKGQSWHSRLMTVMDRMPDPGHRGRNREWFFLQRRP